MPQRRRPESQGIGELADRHRVAREYRIDELVADRLDRPPSESLFLALAVQPGVRGLPRRAPAGLGEGVFRDDVDAGRRGQEPVGDPALRDIVQPRPAYVRLGWVAVVPPGERSAGALHGLLRHPHAAAKRRWERRRA
ncbi:DUF6194 family protein [Agromyces italicus]|uniref:DUF6194 family protein n=1 Tax=Agromyces italicus TaxID=279572 RepID=UPI003D15F959